MQKYLHPFKKNMDEVEEISSDTPPDTVKSESKDSPNPADESPKPAEESDKDMEEKIAGLPAILYKDEVQVGDTLISVPDLTCLARDKEIPEVINLKFDEVVYENMKCALNQNVQEKLARSTPQVAVQEGVPINEEAFIEKVAQSFFMNAAILKKYLHGVTYF